METSGSVELSPAPPAEHPVRERAEPLARYRDSSCDWADAKAKAWSLVKAKALEPESQKQTGSLRALPSSPVKALQPANLGEHGRPNLAVKLRR